VSTIEQLRKQFEQNAIRRVKIGGFDIDGILRGKYVSVEKFWSIVENGMGFCDVIFGWDSSDVLYDRPGITGWHTGYPDTAAVVDLNTFRLIPWEENTAAFLLDFQDTSGRPLEVSPRQVLRKVLAKARAMDLSPTCSCEFEFFIYDESPQSVNDKAFKNPRPLSPGMFGYSWLRTSQRAPLVHALFDQSAQFGIPIEGFHTETGPGVFEAAIRYSDALTAADRAALFKTAAKEICHQYGLMASFMAKPANGLPGCGGHTHQSIWSLDGTTNLFFNPADPDLMTDLMRHYLAGQLALMPELCALFCPNVNSYKRLLDGNWAPGAATWGIENRTTALRAIPGSEKSTRIEHRLPGADLNPYLAMAAMIASGLYGIEHKLECPAPTRGNAYESDAPKLPSSLAKAVASLRRSEIARELLGDTFIEHYLLTRDWEVRQAEKAVTDWELKRYFELS
jgi:glutamine synthetase